MLIVENTWNRRREEGNERTSLDDNNGNEQTSAHNERTNERIVYVCMCVCACVRTGGLCFWDKTTKQKETDNSLDML